jgi:transposase-like protein
VAARDRPNLHHSFSRNTFRLTSRADADAIKRDIKPIYTAVNADTALAALDDLDEKWSSKYRAMIQLWRNAWNDSSRFATMTSRSAGLSVRRTRSNH